MERYAIPLGVAGAAMTPVTAALAVLGAPDSVWVALLVLGLSYSPTQPCSPTRVRRQMNPAVETPGLVHAIPRVLDEFAEIDSVVRAARASGRYSPVFCCRAASGSVTAMC